MYQHCYHALKTFAIQKPELLQSKSMVASAQTLVAKRVCEMVLAKGTGCDVLAWGFLPTQLTSKNPWYSPVFVLDLVLQ